MLLIYGGIEIRQQKCFSRKIVVENTLAQSRIDYILIFQELSKFVRNIYYVETPLSDH